MYVALIALAAAAALPTGPSLEGKSAKPAGSDVEVSRNETGHAAAKSANVRYCIVKVPTGSILQEKTCHTRQEWLGMGYDPLADK